MRGIWSKTQPVGTGRVQQWIRLTSFCVVLAIASVAIVSKGSSFSATLEPETVAVGDTAALKLAFEGSGQIQISPLPSMPGLVVSGPEQGRSVNIINGERTETVSATYYLRPTRADVFEIPAFQAKIGNETFRSDPLQLTAVKATETPASQALAVLRLVVPREKIYLGETMVVELQLLLRGNASNPSEFDMPDFSGSGWLVGQPMQAQRRQAQYGGQIVSIWPIQIPVTPLKAGTLTLGPVNSSVVVQIPAPARRNDPFGGFGFGLFQQTERRRVILSLPAHDIEVLSLPVESAPAGFSGAIGEFDMSVTAGPTNLTVGDPITLKVQLSGRGNMSSINFPDSLVKGDFKSYEPEMKLDTTDDFGLVGVKTIEQIVIPQNTEVHELPPIQFSFFDPEAGEYRTLHHPAIPLVVKPAGSRPAPVVGVGTPAGSSQPSQEDIVHIKQRIGTVPSQSKSAPAVQLLTWNTAPIVAWVGFVLWRKRKNRLERDPRLRRQQQLKSFLNQGFTDLEQQAKEGDSDGFHATMFRMLQEQIGWLLDVPASGITESIIDDGLRELPVDEDTITQLRDLFNACNAARYAPTHDTTELLALIPVLTRTLNSLDRVEP